MTDILRTIESVTVKGLHQVDLIWSDGTRVRLDMRGWAVRDADFVAVTIGDWGHSLVWPSGDEVGADALWRETLRVHGRGDTRAFLDWRLRNALSLGRSAEALGISRRSVAYYSNGERPVPKSILLACKGWDAELVQDMAA